MRGGQAPLEISKFPSFFRGWTPRLGLPKDDYQMYAQFFICQTFVLVDLALCAIFCVLGKQKWEILCPDRWDIFLMVQDMAHPQL